jgi:hypothetical protein
VSLGRLQRHFSWLRSAQGLLPQRAAPDWRCCFVPAGLSASRLVDLFELATPGGAAGPLDENGPDELLRQVRATKRSDDACDVYLVRF